VAHDPVKQRRLNPASAVGCFLHAVRTWRSPNSSKWLIMKVDASTMSHPRTKTAQIANLFGRCRSRHWSDSPAACCSVRYRRSVRRTSCAGDRGATPARMSPNGVGSRSKRSTSTPSMPINVLAA
jgi:hypothetical protein